MKPLFPMILLCCLGASTALSAPALTHHQAWALTEAQRAGMYYEPKQELYHDFTATLQAILGQESSFCVDKHRRDPLSWGCGQLTVSTAQLFDSNATAEKLLKNDRYNIWLSAAYLAYCAHGGNDWYAMVRCYHGRKAKDGDEYVRAILARLAQASEAHAYD